jgi:hypothetical protein
VGEPGVFQLRVEITETLFQVRSERDRGLMITTFCDRKRLRPVRLEAVGNDHGGCATRNSINAGNSSHQDFTNSKQESGSP